MAIVQISRITHRKGNSENLPQLAGAELGWAIDQRRLYIGNGTLEEGAPVIGNTEILTEFSDILAYAESYTYKGEAAGYTVQTGPQANDPVTRSLQSKLDDMVSIKDFGATGDGITDDTEAINRALYQLFCREVNPEIRRSVFFPAGVYKVIESIVIPPYARLYGEGGNSSIIKLETQADISTLSSYVARTGDSLQQIGANIGTNGAALPGYVEIQGIGFQTDEATDIFLVDQAQEISFIDCDFIGPLTQALITNPVTRDDIAGIVFNSTSGTVCRDITAESCRFSNLTYGVNTALQIEGVSITDSRFDTLYQGVVLGGSSVTNGGPKGVRVKGCLFDNIYAEGIDMENVSMNASAYNAFFDVANAFNGAGSPATPVITIESANNLSIGDLFERDDADAAVYARVSIVNTITGLTVGSVEFDSSAGMKLGSKKTTVGLVDSLTDNDSGTITTVDCSVTPDFFVDYAITRSTGRRTGRMTVAASPSSSVVYADDYTETTALGVTLAASLASNTVSITYSTTSTGDDAAISYSITSQQQ